MPFFHRDSMSSSPRSSQGSGYSSASSGGGSRHGRHSHSQKYGFLGPRRSNEDRATTAARERVYAAEEAERAADKALYASRRAVLEARNNVKDLEREAREDARLAKLKQSQAKDISKRVKPLGRHY